MRSDDDRTHPPPATPQEPARVQHCEAAVSLTGECQVWVPRKPAGLVVDAWG